MKRRYVQHMDFFAVFQLIFMFVKQEIVFNARRWNNEAYILIHM